MLYLAATSLGILFFLLYLKQKKYILTNYPLAVFFLALAVSALALASFSPNEQGSVRLAADDSVKILGGGPQSGNNSLVKSEQSQNDSNQLSNTPFDTTQTDNSNDSSGAPPLFSFTKIVNPSPSFENYEFINGDLIVKDIGILRVKPNAIDSEKIRWHSIRQADLASGSVTSRVIQDGTIQGADISENTELIIKGLTVSEDATFLGDLSVSGTIIGSIAGSFAPSGDVDMANYILTNIGNAGTDFDTSGGLTLAGQLNVNGAGNNYFAGNVGIGTATPNNLLQVANLIDFNNTDLNTKLGYQAGKNIVAGAQYNTFVGYQAGLSSATLSTNGADYNSGFGYRSLSSNTKGNANTANGAGSLSSNTKGNANTANGRSSLSSNTTGDYNTANGYYSLYANTTGNYNTANGAYSLEDNTTGYENTANGSYSLSSNTTGNRNTANGRSSLSSNTTGNHNTANGAYSLEDNTTGNANTANGYASLSSNTTGYENTANGINSLYFNTTGWYNTANGNNSGRYIANGATANQTSNNSLYLGHNTRALANGDTNEIVIGASAIGNGSNSVTLGNTSITKTILQGNVGIGTTNPGNLLTLGAYNSGTSGSQKQGLLSTDNMLLASLAGGAYFGRVGVRESALGLSDYGATWVQKDATNRSYSGVAMSSDGKIQTAVENGGGIYVSTDYGATWVQKDATARSRTGVAMSSDGKIQTAVDFGIDYDGIGSIYVSTDYGATWVQKDAPARYYIDVAMSSDGKIQTAVDPETGGIYVSTDYGATWVQKDAPGYAYESVAMSSDGKIQTTVENGGGIYVSTDYGATWVEEDATIRDYKAVAMSSDGKIQTAVDSYGEGIFVSTDYGATWAQVDATARGDSHVAMSSDGKIQTAVDPETGSIYASTDYGATWVQKDAPDRNYAGVAMSSDGKIQTTVENGGGIYVSHASVSTLGNVGIGTTSPLELLDINGRLHLAQTTAPGTTTDRLYNVSGNLLWNGVNLTGGGALPGATEGYTLRGNGSAWQATNSLFVKSDGNVGIGTTSLVTGTSLTLANGLGINYTDGSHADQNILTATPSNVTKGPFRWYVNDHAFNGTNDYASLFGYNIRGDGTGATVPVVATEPSLFWGMEQDYYNGSVHAFEHYLEWDDANVGIGFARPIGWNFNRTTGNMLYSTLQGNTIFFDTWENPAHHFASLSTNGASVSGAAISGPSFTILPLTNQTYPSSIGVQAGNSQQAYVYVYNGTQLAYFQTNATGVEIYDSTAGSVLTLKNPTNIIDGNVGIGDTSPDYLLELYNATNTPTFALSDDDIAHGVTTLAQTDSFFHLSSISTTVGGAQLTGLADATGIALGLKGIQSSDPTDTTPAISLIGSKASGTGVQDLGAAETVFQVANNDNAAALTVLGSGDAIFGGSLVHINNDWAEIGLGADRTYNRLTLENNTNVGLVGKKNVWIGIDSDNSGTDATFGIVANDNWLAGTETPLFVVTESGNVGIGTANPAYNLHVAAADSARVLIQETSETSGDTASLLFKSATDSGAGYAKAAIIFENAGLGNGLGNLHFAVDTAADSNGAGIADAKITIDSNGNVGIGKTNPGSLLTVKGGDIVLREDDDGFDAISIFASTSSGAINYMNGGVTKVTIQGNSDSYFNADNAKVGIGIDASALGKLHVKESGAKTATNYAGYFENASTNATTDAINKYGAYITSTGIFTGSTGAATNNYGLYMVAATGGDANYGLYINSSESTTGNALYINNTGTNDSIVDDSGALLSATGTWTDAPSYRAYKENYMDTGSYLDKLMTMDVYEWQYKNETIDGMNRFAADPNRHASPFLDDFYNTFGLGNINGYNIQDLAGVTIASVKELNQRFINQDVANTASLEALTLKTDQNITTLQGLQTSVDEQLVIISNSQLSISNQFSNLNDQMALLQAQIDELKQLNNLELNVAQIEANTTDIEYLKTLLGITPTSAPGDVSILGRLSAEITETGSIVINIKDNGKDTIGSGEVTVAGTVDENGNVSDGKSVKIKTEAITENSKVYLTPINSTGNQALYVGAVTSGEGFEVKVDAAIEKNIKFNWWIIETDKTITLPISS